VFEDIGRAQEFVDDPTPTRAAMASRSTSSVSSEWDDDDLPPLAPTSRLEKQGRQVGHNNSSSKHSNVDGEKASDTSLSSSSSSVDEAEGGIVSAAADAVARALSLSSDDKDSSKLGMDISGSSASAVAALTSSISSAVVAASEAVVKALTLSTDSKEIDQSAGTGIPPLPYASTAPREAWSADSRDFSFSAGSIISARSTASSTSPAIVETQLSSVSPITGTSPACPSTFGASTDSGASPARSPESFTTYDRRMRQQQQDGYQRHLDQSKWEPTVILHPEFDVIPTLHPERGGVPVIDMRKVLKEAAEDVDLQEKLIAGQVPFVETVFRYTMHLFCFIHLKIVSFRFMLHLQTSAKYPIECNLVALVYLNRCTSSEKHRLLLTMENWRMVWASLIILAQKVWDDRALRTSSFTRILPGISRTQLRNFELQLLTILDFDTGVTPSQYAQYYFEMRHLFEQIMGHNVQASEWRMKPLTMRSAFILEDRCRKMLVSVDKDKGKDRSRQHTSSHQVAHGVAGTGSTNGSAPGGATVGVTPRTAFQQHQFYQQSFLPNNNSDSTSGVANSGADGGKSSVVGGGNIIGASNVSIPVRSQADRLAFANKSVGLGSPRDSLNRTLEDVTVSDRSRFVIS
jgi:hypothetical protein